jgi:hypothetical protein
MFEPFNCRTLALDSLTILTLWTAADTKLKMCELFPRLTPAEAIRVGVWIRNPQEDLLIMMLSEDQALYWPEDIDSFRQTE